MLPHGTRGFDDAPDHGVAQHGDGDFVELV
jgi:hypothetical protein